MTDKEMYYERIQKIVGTYLLEKRLNIVNSPFVSKAMQLLASCGVLTFSFPFFKHPISKLQAKIWGIDISGEKYFEDGFEKFLKSHNQFEDRFSFHNSVRNNDIVLGGGSLAKCYKAYLLARQQNVPLIVGLLLKGGLSLVSVFFPGQPFYWEKFDFHIVNLSQIRYFDWIDLNNQMANLAKAILLKGTKWQRPDINRLLKSGKTSILLAHPTWPWANRYLNLKNGQDVIWLKRVIQENRYESTAVNCYNKRILIVGLGSLGGPAADHFRILGANIIGIDGKKVSIYNPVRQEYPTSMIGKEKAFALSKILTHREYPQRSFLGFNKMIPDSSEGAAWFDGIVTGCNPDLVILTTAHPVEHRLTHILRERNIPHIIGRCYRRARWFEVTFVDGLKGPCFGCLQGHLYTGKIPTMTEEQLAFYDTHPELAQGITMVEAEPATRVETSRCFDTIARIGAQLLAEKRNSWFIKMASEERTCLIGGNHSEYNTKEKNWTFGIPVPGGTAIYGIINFIGSESEQEKKCLYCGRVNKIFIHTKGSNNDIPKIDEEDMAKAMESI